MPICRNWHICQYFLDQNSWQSFIEKLWLYWGYMVVWYAIWTEILRAFRICTFLKSVATNKVYRPVYVRLGRFSDFKWRTVYLFKVVIRKKYSGIVTSYFVLNLYKLKTFFNSKLRQTLHRRSNLLKSGTMIYLHFCKNRAKNPSFVPPTIYLYHNIYIYLD